MDKKYQNYIKLYEKVKKHNKSNQSKLTICPAIKGKDYKKGGIMFVGRAINSWCPLDDNEDITKRIGNCEKCTLDWVVGENQWDHCQNNNCPYSKGKIGDYRKNYTPFWNLIRNICKENDMGEDWYKKIVWTNLYKASYKNGGNPEGFYEEQVEICNEILINDIQRYKPSKIYFITEKNEKKRTWFCSEYKGTNVNFKKVYDYLYDDKNIEVYVLVRPEFKKIKDVYDKRQGL